jgi:hypothetical protein
VIVFEPPAAVASCGRCQQDLRGGQEEHRGDGWDREVNGVDGDAVKELGEAVRAPLPEARRPRWRPWDP